MRPYLSGLAVLAILTPLGSLAAGTAWGEWGTDELATVLGYIPQGIEQASSWWTAVFPDYSMSFLGQGEIPGKVGYFLSAVFGSGLIYLTMSLYGKILLKADSQSTLGRKG